EARVYEQDCTEKGYNCLLVAPIGRGKMEQAAPHAYCAMREAFSALTTIKEDQSSGPDAFVVRALSSLEAAKGRMEEDDRLVDAGSTPSVWSVSFKGSAP